MPRYMQALNLPSFSLKSESPVRIKHHNHLNQEHVNGDDVETKLVRAQEYNDPTQLYSEENYTEAFIGQTGCLIEDYPGYVPNI